MPILNTCLLSDFKIVRILETCFIKTRCMSFYFFKSILFVILSSCLFWSSCTKMKKPNVIIIFTDDMGYGDMGCYGHPTINTPALDQLVAQGIKLTQFCVAASVCTPSRAGLLTGRYPVRYGLEQGVIHPDSHHGLPSEEVTIAELLKQDGYTTACIGKWHLGHRDGLLPTDQGFDYFYGIPFSNDMSRREQQLLGWESYHYQLPLMEQKDTLLLDPEQEYFTRHFTEKALRWLYQNKDKAFFFTWLIPCRMYRFIRLMLFKGKVKEDLMVMRLKKSIGVWVRS